MLRPQPHLASPHCSPVPTVAVLCGSPDTGGVSPAGNKDQIAAIIDANIIPPLISLLGTAEFDIKKEAAWAISNATSGGTHQQIKYFVTQVHSVSYLLIPARGLCWVLLLGSRACAGG